MSTILKKDINVNEKGIATIPFDIIEEFIDSTLAKIPFEFNNAENKLVINTGINKNFLNDYNKKKVRQQRRFIHFSITEKKIRKSEKQFKEALNSFTDKITALDDLSKLQETLKDVNNIYELKKTFLIFFNKSNYLRKFYNSKFDIELIKNEKGKKKLVLNFKSFGDIMPRTLDKTIHQGTLLIHKDGPPKIIKHFINKDYAIIKLHSLMDNHSEGLKDVYDLVITCDKNKFSKIFNSKGYKNPNVSFGKYSKDESLSSQNIYVSKLKFDTFLKSFGQKFLYINNLDNNEIVEIPFYEDLYDKYLIENIYSSEELKNIKKKINRGLSKYYTQYKNFLEYLKKTKSSKSIQDLNKKDTLILQGIEESIIDEKFTSSEKVYEQYLIICENAQVKPFKILTFKKHLESLHQMKYISIRSRRGAKDNPKIPKNIFLNKPLSELDDMIYKDLDFTFDHLNKLDFLNISKRERFDIDVRIHFMNNLDIVLTRDKELNINYSSDLLIEEFNINFQKGKDAFLKKYESYVDKKNLYKITEEYSKNILYFLKELRGISMLDLNLDFILDIFYFSSILKKNINLIRDKFEIRDQSLSQTIPIVLGVQIAFQKHFRKENALDYYNLFFTSKFVNFPNINRNLLYKIRKYCQDMIFIFESAQDLNILKKEFKDKFQGNFEFKYIVKNIEDLIKPKLDIQKDLLKIYNDIKKNIPQELDTKKNIDEIRKILEQKLKADFSSQTDFDEATKSIEILLTSKLTPKINYDNILNQIDFYFSQKLTKKKQIDEITNYIEENLKNEFKDKRKFNTIIKKIENIYNSKFENKKYYSSIIRQINKYFKELNSEEDLKKIKKYIEVNLKNLFESESKQESIIRQIDRTFMSRKENPQELEDIIKMCFSLVKLLISDTIWHSILTSSIFSLFILSLNKEKEIPLGSISKLLGVLPTSISLHVKRIIESEMDTKKYKSRFTTLRITDEETREKVRNKLVEILLGSQIHLIFNTKSSSKHIKILNEEFKFRMDFFSRYKQFNPSLEPVSNSLIDKYIKGFVREIKNEEVKRDKDYKINLLTYRLNFFRKYKVFDKALMPLKDEIKNLEFLSVNNEDFLFEKVS